MLGPCVTMTWDFRLARLACVVMYTYMFMYMYVPCEVSRHAPLSVVDTAALTGTSRKRWPATRRLSGISWSHCQHAAMRTLAWYCENIVRTMITVATRRLPSPFSIWSTGACACIVLSWRQSFSYYQWPVLLSEIFALEEV